MPLTEQALTGVIGARGVQGSAIEQSLAGQGVRTRGLGRSLPSARVDREYASADLAEPHRLAEAFAGLSALCFTMPLVYDTDLTRAYAQNVAQAAADAGIDRIVLNSNTRIPQHTTTVAGFETRRATEEIFRGSGVPVAVVRPTIYLENLLAPPVVAAVERNGVLPYPVPAEMPVAWMSVRDLGSTIANVLRAESFPEEVIDVGGLEMTGPELAAALSESLGKELSFVSLDPTDFESGLAQALGTDSARGVAGLYHWLNANPESQLMSEAPSRPVGYAAEPISITDWAATSWP